MEAPPRNDSCPKSTTGQDRTSRRFSGCVLRFTHSIGTGVHWFGPNCFPLQPIWRMAPTTLAHSKVTTNVLVRPGVRPSLGVEGGLAADGARNAYDEQIEGTQEQALEPVPELVPPV